jgi:hypothetical protein
MVFFMAQSSAKVRQVLETGGMQKRRRQPAFTVFAVFMLLAQLVLTAGHFHVGPRSSIHSAGTASSPRLVLGSDPVSPLHSDDQCELCWAQLGASTSLIPPPVLLPLPSSAPALQPGATVHGPLPSTIPSAYRSRAPPPLALA